MQIVVNERYVKSKVRLGNRAHIASLVLMALGFILSLQLESLGTQAIYVAYVALIGALVLLSFGRNFTRRFGPRFRQDGWLAHGLKGLDNQHTLFNYASPDLPDHILVGPTGLYILIPKTNGGTIRFDGNRWSRGSVGGSLFRGLTEGGLGNPFGEVEPYGKRLAAYLTKHGSEELTAELKAHYILVFTNPNARLEVRHSPIPVVQPKELKSLFRKPKTTLEPEKVAELKRLLGEAVTP